MKRTSILFSIIFLGMIIKSFSQSTDFYAGKWEIMIYGSPMGDIKFKTELIRKDGKLTGELAYADEPDKPKRPITKIEENGDNLKIYFESSQGGDVFFDFKKENENTLKGNISGYESVAKRIKD
jgi:hypothetical protein